MLIINKLDKNNSIKKSRFVPVWNSSVLAWNIKSKTSRNCNHGFQFTNYHVLPARNNTLFTTLFPLAHHIRNRYHEVLDHSHLCFNHSLTLIVKFFIFWVK